MLRSASELHWMALHATDGNLGHVEEFYFDDDTWTLRYFVVDAGSWLSSRRVLITPGQVASVDWAHHALSVSLSMSLVRDSPDIDTQQPVSRLQETEYLRYYNQTTYWARGIDVATTALPAAARAVAARDEANGVPPPSHLRSSTEVIGYQVDAADGSIGRLQDFILDDGSWRIRYVAIAMSNWGLGREVVLPPEWVERIGWAERKLAISFDREAIRNSPAYETVMRLTPEYEAELMRHYGRPRVWK